MTVVDDDTDTATGTVVALPDSPLDAAEAYAALGWRVVPIAPGTKYPHLPAWQDAATDDLAIIRSWWNDLYRGHGVGLTTGPASGFWVLDVDVAEGKTGADTLAALNAEHGKLPPTVTAITGSGGLHLLFNWDPQRPVTNGDAAHLGPGLDIRGAGGQIVVAPTVHPNGTPYAWHTQRHPWGPTGIADAPEWLYELLQPTHAPAQEPIHIDINPRPANGVAINLPHTDSSDSIAEWVNERHDWATLLQLDGWTIHSTRTGESWWTRPGKDRRQGHSAVLHEPDGPLVVFTTEISADLATAGTPTADGSGISFSKFGYIAGTRHAGDRSETARAARQDQRALQPAPTPPTVPDLAPEDVFTDLARWWDHQEPQRAADVLTRTDGTGLLYLDQLNWIHGDSGSGKTWVLLAAVAQLIANGTHVAWVHYEDPNPGTVISRLKLLGANRTHVLERFHYHDPHGDPLNTSAIIAACTRHNIAFVALDSIGEALNASGIDEDHDASVGPWITNGPRAIVNAGIGFCGVDHGTKAGTNKLHPSGSKRKRAALTGAGLLIEPITAPTRHTDGQLRITCAKDRHGNHPQGEVVGIAHLRHNITTGGIDFTVAAPAQAVDEHAQDVAIREVVRAVEQTPGLSRKKIKPLMPTMSQDRKDEAIDRAVALGFVTVEPGPRGAQLLHPATPEKRVTT